MAVQKPMKHLFFYIVTIGLSLLILWGLLGLGPSDSSLNTVAANSDLNVFARVQQEFVKNLGSPITGLLIQLFVILGFSRLCSFVFGKIGQPQVIGEMIAGILLGKSVFAALWPIGFEAIFPESSMPRLYFLSQVGLIFFTFVIGLELKGKRIMNRFVQAAGSGVRMRSASRS